ncbi:acyl-CoA dehydrogenase family protein [Lipingzhangella sp. LS1_29]|uniref:Acyl-CoA dehydrogenase family protein n=1 Tax=Lipingzhangella rawalii TaxID=2055835 RepID=A0ABU2HB58_9ACTN|nr:acyl-CoA dehydrogenase family protein [Lipingzhangella rawalii]MDS1272222.1 acyl-CoA dehydrogenase family protein [Lipingzhangella rawalii]
MIEWSDTDELLRQAVREFIDKEIRPHSTELESGELPPFDTMRRFLSTFGVDTMARDGVEQLLRRNRERSTQPGDSEHTGTAADSSNLGENLAGSSFEGQESLALLAISELAGASLGLVVSLGVSLGLTTQTILARGTHAQQERWLPKLATLEHVGAWAITEPDSGSDALGGMRTRVTRDGDDYILNGQKTFITNGPYADVIVVFAKLDEQDGTDPRDRPVLAFVLDAGMEGLTQGPPLAKMGLRSSPTGELFFDNVRLSRDRLLGETERQSGGQDSSGEVKSSFTFERIGVAALGLGIINECQRLSIDYARTCTRWGQEIGRFQLIQLKLARMEVARINVQNMVFSSIEQIRAGTRPSLAEASAMKLYAAEAATEVAMDAVQLFGGNGYMAEYQVERLARDAKSLMIYAGSNEIQVTHIAKGLLS